jgi:hypothetical protein
MVTYEFAAAYGSNEKDRCKLLEDFCDAVLRENARRAVTIGTPLSFQQARERWRDLAELKRSGSRGNSGYQQQQQQQQQSSQQGQRGGLSAGRGGAPRRGGGSGGTGFSRPGGGRSPSVFFNNELVCFHYNNPGGCNRAAKGSGCDNGRGGAYAHVCIHEFSAGHYCFAKHPKHANH